MTTSLTVRAAVDSLRSRLLDGASTLEIVSPLRVMQQSGLSQAELTVHVERVRMMNELGSSFSEEVEDATLRALDLITGFGGNLSLRWDPPAIASIYVRRSLDVDLLRESAEYAVTPSDLLPPRPTDGASPGLVEQLVTAIGEELETGRYLPVPADQLRVPKGSFTSRPAALLAIQDRFSYEALASLVAKRLPEILPDEVSWPRGRDQIHDVKSIFGVPTTWDAAFVIKADIESYFDCVDHGILSAFLGSYLGMPTDVAQATEALLDTVMSARTGLPQGPPGSDVLATAYLLPIDLTLREWGWTFVRYMDDYFIAAESLQECRAKLEDLEDILRDVGLRLNASKTRPMHRDTYEDNLGQPSDRMRRLQAKLISESQTAVVESDDPDYVTWWLERYGVEEQTLWDLFYHQSISLEDLLADHPMLGSPDVVDLHRRLLRDIVKDLNRPDTPDDMVSAEADAIRAIRLLTATTTKLPEKQIVTALTWFPRSAPAVSDYLGRLAGESAPMVRKLIERLLTSGEFSDWVMAWVCSVPEAHPKLVARNLRSALIDVVRDERLGSLTRITALRALRGAGWPEAQQELGRFQSLSPSMQSELLFSWDLDPTAYLGITKST